MLKGQSSKFFRGFFYASSHGDCLYHCTFKTEMQQRNCPFFIAQRSCSHHSSSGAAHFQRTSRQSPTACSFRPFPIGRLSLREGTFVSSRWDVRLFPKGRFFSHRKDSNNSRREQGKCPRIDGRNPPRVPEKEYPRCSPCSAAAVCRYSSPERAKIRSPKAKPRTVPLSHRP